MGAQIWSAKFFFFTEMGYTAYPQDEAKEMGYNNLMFPNEHFRPEKARNSTGCTSTNCNTAPRRASTA